MHDKDFNTIAFDRRRFLKAIATISATGTLAGMPGRYASAADADLNEQSAYQLGLQAYIYGYPLIYFARLRYLRMVEGDPMLKRPQLWGQWSHRNLPVTPEIVGAPQTDTVYSNLWLDLHGEPYVLTIPHMDGRYWSIQCCDLLGTTFGVVNRRNRSAGGRVAVVGPNWQGELPKSIDVVLRARMPESLQVMRMFFADHADLARVTEFQQRFEVAPLSAYLSGRTAVPGIQANLPRPLTPAQDPLADFRTLQAIWQESPPPVEDAAVTAPFAAIGIATGRTGFDQLPPDIIRGLQRAERDGRQQVIAATRDFSGRRSSNGWTLPKADIGYYADHDYLYRATVAQAGTVALPIDENPYHALQTDSTGAVLSGDRRYALHFAADQIPQVSAFWSLHAYGPRYTVIDNPIGRYSIGDRTKGLTYGNDGSLTVYIQADDPGEARRNNWLPVRTGELFWLLIRAYEPEGTMKSLQWKGPTIARV